MEYLLSFKRKAREYENEGAVKIDKEVKAWHTLGKQD